MIRFQHYIVEAAKTASEDKLSHLEHAEDHPINAGAAGFQHAKKTLNAVHSSLTGGKSNATVSTKYDGSPSIVFGHHPETGKFFVASKSAFNKDPKINYNNADIEKNHGHAPGLVNKLKTALKHLPKVAPKEGVFQGDIMHSGVKSKSNPHGDVELHGNQAHFTPNTITYSTKKTSEANKVAKSKIGVAVHTAYHGPTFEKMKASYNAGHEGFGTHPDVHLMNVHHDSSQTQMAPKSSAKFQEHMAKAEEHHQALQKSGGYKAIEGEHGDHLKTYINKTVRTGEKPSIEGFQAHVHEYHQKAADKLKSPAGKARVAAVGATMASHIEKNKDHIGNILGMHQHLQAAKNELVHTLASHTDYGHTTNGKATKPEGHVAVINNRPTKLVDRAEFSRNNFNKNAK